MGECVDKVMTVVMEGCVRGVVQAHQRWSYRVGETDVCCIYGLFSDNVNRFDPCTTIHTLVSIHSFLYNEFKSVQQNMFKTIVRPFYLQFFHYLCRKVLKKSPLHAFSTL